MLSGRYRSEFFCRHFKANHSGLCSSPTCEDVAGTLEHILISCPAYSITRDEQFSLCLSNTVMFPFLHGFIRQIINSDENTKAQFFLEPLAFEVIRQESNNHGMHYLSTLNYICRSFVFSIHREYINRIKNKSWSFSGPWWWSNFLTMEHLYWMRLVDDLDSFNLKS